MDGAGEEERCRRCAARVLVSYPENLLIQHIRFKKRGAGTETGVLSQSELSAKKSFVIG
jgi:hypothetical protein